MFGYLGFGIWDLGLCPRGPAPNSKSQIRNPKSARRRGVTIMEVLFATMITGVGLLAAITLLPLAANQAQRARNADASTTASTTAVAYFDAMAMRRPANWVAYDAPINGNPTNTGNPRNVWQEYIAFLANPANGRNWLGGFDSFCIDPRMTASNQKDNSDPTLGVIVAANDGNNPPQPVRASTFPRNVFANQPYMWRLGLANGGTTPMNRLMANTVFTIDDDLNYDRVADESVVAAQIFDTLPADPTRLARRRIDGRLSWLATLTPKLDRYSVILTDTYVLSIVIFHDRPASLAIANADPLNERMLGVPSLPGLGVMGGEVVLGWPNAPLTVTQSAANDETAEEMLDIHTGEWIMLAGTVPHTVLGDIAVFKWYRVTDSDPEIDYNATAQQYQRYFTISGQDWVAANTRAVALEGVVGVVEKTIRLEP